MARKVVTLVKTQGLFNKRTCMDCKERMNINNFPVLSYGCRHYPKICHMCLLVRINAHLDAGNRTPLPCPYPNCTECLTPTAITRMPYTKQLMFEYMVAVTPPDASSASSATGAQHSASNGGHAQKAAGHSEAPQQQTLTTAQTTTRTEAAIASSAAAVIAQ